MNKSDIRYGNIVKIDNEKHHPKLKEKPLIVVGFSMNRDDFCVHLNSPIYRENYVMPMYSQFFKYIKGIYLNEYLLVDVCKFEKSENVYILDGAFTISFFDSYYYVHYFSDNRFIKRISYLHELQNLTFDLFNEDLKIDLK